MVYINFSKCSRGQADEDFYPFFQHFVLKKYGMTYKEFENENVVAKRDFSWKVESDAQEWKMAIISEAQSD
jgi:hypothetical protein